MDAHASCPSEERATHQMLRADLEATCQAFHALLATLTPADWSRPSTNPAWTIGEVLWHITGYAFMIPDQLAWLREGTYAYTTYVSADALTRGNERETREGAQVHTFSSIAQVYEEGHAATLAALSSL